MSDATQPRRQFLASLPAMFLALGAGKRRPGRGATAPDQGTHPDPRPGIDGSRVATAEQLRDHPDVIPIFDGIRKIPRIADGLRCHCGCADQPGYRSLLTCYEGEDAMAAYCTVCQGQGKLAYKLFKQGKDLHQIRAAIDARFG